MPSKKALNTLGQGSHRSGKKNGRVSRRGGGYAGLVTEERLATERAALVAERQSQLDGIMDTHDTLVSDFNYAWGVSLHLSRHQASGGISA